MKNSCVFWMHLSKKDNKLLSPIIKKLSEKYLNEYTFPPHITISSWAQIEQDEAIDAALKSIEGIKKFEVKMDSIKYSNLCLLIF